MKVVLGVSAGLISLGSVAGFVGYKLDETNRYAKQLGLPEQNRAIVRQLEYDANTKALLDEISYLPGEIQVSERVLNYLEDINGNVDIWHVKKVTNKELARFQDLDRDELNNRDELKYGTNILKPNPNVNYILDNGIPVFVEQIKLLDEDGIQDENEKVFIDTLLEYSESEQAKLLTLTKDGKIDYNERALIEIISSLPKALQTHEKTSSYLEEIIQDTEITNEEVSGFGKLDHDEDWLSYEQEKSFGTDPLKPNPNVNYILNNGIPVFVEQIKLLDEDGIQDENEKVFIDALLKYSESERAKLLTLTKDGKIDYNERALIDYLFSIEKAGITRYESKGIVARSQVVQFLREEIIDSLLLDGVSNEDTKVLTYLSTLPGKTQRDLIGFGLNNDTLEFLLKAYSLQDKEFAEYVASNKFCFEDRNLSELEAKFLQEPDIYAKEVFDYYMSETKKLNPELYDELLVIPDLKNLEIKDIEATEDILYLAKNPEYNKLFKSIFEEGIKGKRQYNSALQALLWTAYDEEFVDVLSQFLPDSAMNLPRDNYLLTDILKAGDSSYLVEHAWKHTTTSKNYTSERWKNFDEVVGRLNSPKLVNMYMIDNISGIPDGCDYWQTPLKTFNRKGGDCEDHAIFATYCLEENGYETYVLVVYGKTYAHAVCLYKENSFYYYIDNLIANNVGPFKSIKETSQDVFIKEKVLYYNIYTIDRLMKSKLLNR